MTIRVNGEERQVPGGSTLADLLAGLDIPETNVVVERNGEVVARATLSQTRLNPGDRLEIVRFVGGG